MDIEIWNIYDIQKTLCQAPDVIRVIIVVYYCISYRLKYQIRNVMRFHWAVQFKVGKN